MDNEKKDQVKPKKDKPVAAKKKPVAPVGSGLDWDKLRADFEALYDPKRGVQVAGQIIARLVVSRLIELKGKAKK